VSPSAHPRRHAACSCGSGALFAGCCARWEAAFRRLTARLAAFGEAPAQRAAAEEAEAAFQAHGPGSASRRERTLGSLRFLEWFLHDHEPEAGRGTLLGRFADRAAGLTWHEEQLLLGLLLAPLRAHQAGEPLGSGALGLRDLLTGAEGRVGPAGLPDTLIRSDLLVCRVVSLGATGRPGPTLLRLPGTAREELMAYLRAAYRLGRPGRHVSLEDFLDGSAHLYHHFFDTRGRELGGQPLETAPRLTFAPARIRYAGRDAARIRAALARQSALEPESGDAGEHFTWLDLAHGIPGAGIRLLPDGVEVQADTREHLEQVQGFVEGVLRGLIETPGACTFVHAQPAGGPGGGAGAGVGGREFLLRIFQRWPDTPSVHLRSRIPREVAVTPAGRHEVAGVLAGLERDMARQRRLRRGWVDLTPVREALDVPP
jgi:hypothetical protein